LPPEGKGTAAVNGLPQSLAFLTPTHPARRLRTWSGAQSSLRSIAMSAPHDELATQSAEVREQSRRARQEAQRLLDDVLRSRAAVNRHRRAINLRDVYDMPACKEGRCDW
jgi:hypothetical protein